MKPANRNMELKCRCDDLNSVRDRCHAISARDMGLLHQRDTFFNAPLARLKLREFQEGAAELISYQRPNVTLARGSDYLIARVDRGEDLRNVLCHALGPAGVVVKRRHLFLYKNTRVHLDDVEGLGTFVELETVISNGMTDADALAELDWVARALELDRQRTVPGAYVDLL